MIELSMREMLEAGAHFGHQTHRWDPRMKPYIYGAKNGVHIIDLQKTVPLLKEACAFISRVVSEGGEVLFVGTKKQAKPIIEDEAKKVSIYYVTNRWLGGTLTNYSTVKKSIQHLMDLEKKMADGSLGGLTKMERLVIEREIIKLAKVLGGIKEMSRLPAVVFLVDPVKEAIALKEANRLQIPIVALADTNCNPEGVDYLIPGNDDAIKSIRFFVSKVVQACQEGMSLRQSVTRERVAAESDEKKGSAREVAGGKGRAYVSKPEAYENNVAGEYRGDQAPPEAASSDKV